MNAISPLAPTQEAQAAEAAERRARHLAVCQELIDLGMQLARAAAKHGLAAWEETPTRAQQPNETPPARTPDANLAFERISRSIRHAVALEAQIANGTLPPAPRAPDPEHPEDENWSEPGNLSEVRLRLIHRITYRSALVGGLQTAVGPEGDPWRRYTEFTGIANQSLDDHPDDTLTQHFHRICTTLGLPTDPTMMPENLTSVLEPSILQAKITGPPAGI